MEILLDGKHHPINISSYILRFLKDKGIDTVFTVVGGGSMYLNDALIDSGMNVIHCHHEQACAYAAVGYTKYTHKPCIVLVTTGCGSTNTITGLLDAFQDSVPIIFISGQANIQGCDIGAIVMSIVKFYREFNISNIIPSLESAYDILIKENKPVWLSIPLDIQKEDII